jgi:hypothetical protein
MKVAVEMCNIAGEVYSKVASSRLLRAYPRSVPYNLTIGLPSCNSSKPVQESVAMTLRHATRALAIVSVALFVAGGAHAQDVTLPNPDSSYATSPDNFQTSSDLTMPTVDDQASPDTVTIPIPGGGEITVDGPDAPSDTPLPNLPGSQWGITEQTPYSHDVGPTMP